MATYLTIGGNGDVYIGEDKVLSLPVVQDDCVTPQDITGWAIQFVVRKEKASTTVLVNKTATISGTFSPTDNPQRAVVTLSDEDLAVTVFPNQGTYYHSWKRMDDGSETILAEGKFVIERATQV